ncbi:MAG: metal-dependent hydrolase [Clostridiales bacterium]|nr:metal-dependent hydrolase [Clostridiales bacterium]
MHFTVIRSRRKSISLRVISPEEAQVRAPLQTPQKEIENFVRSKQAWIISRVREMERRSSLARFSEADRKNIKKRAEAELPVILHRREAQMGVRAGKLSFRFQKTRFGSCTSKGGNISLNCLLVLMPRELQDYVIVHELCHIRHPDHSPAFWKEVEKYCPDCKELRKRTQQLGAELIARLP